MCLLSNLLQENTITAECLHILAKMEAMTRWTNERIYAIVKMNMEHIFFNSKTWIWSNIIDRNLKMPLSVCQFWESEEGRQKTAALFAAAAVAKELYLHRKASIEAQESVKIQEQIWITTKKDRGKCLHTVEVLLIWDFYFYGRTFEWNFSDMWLWQYVY